MVILRGIFIGLVEENGGGILCFQSHGGGDDLTKSLFFAIILDMPSKDYKKLTPPMLHI